MVLAIHLSGKLENADYERFVPEFEQFFWHGKESCACFSM
jgi:hypothetical protein